MLTYRRRSIFESRQQQTTPTFSDDPKPGETSFFLERESHVSRERKSDGLVMVRRLTRSPPHSLSYPFLPILRRSTMSTLSTISSSSISTVSSSPRVCFYSLSSSSKLFAVSVKFGGGARKLACPCFFAMAELVKDKESASASSALVAESGGGGGGSVSAVGSGSGAERTESKRSRAFLNASSEEGRLGLCLVCEKMRGRK